jgi:hypothetical protein
MWMNTQIVALDTNINIYYSPWFPRGADNAVFMAEILKDTFTGNSMEITVYTKNAEDEGSGATPVATLSTLTGGFVEANVTGLKELVRFGMEFKAGAAGEGAEFRILPPTWYDKAV